MPERCLRGQASWEHLPRSTPHETCPTRQGDSSYSARPVSSMRARAVAQMLAASARSSDVVYAFTPAESGNFQLTISAPWDA